MDQKHLWSNIIDYEWKTKRNEKQQAKSLNDHEKSNKN